ncbi:MAG: nitroreductase family protein [Alphaproteobacteria bacterium]|nr:nitroreductase family protein [Alphaproteobacteria bacterium]
MHTFEAIRSRRAVKHFDPNHRLTKDEENMLIDLACQTPSSFNIQHWRLVKVTDPKLRHQIREVSADQAQVTDASLLLVVCGDVKAWEKNPKRYWNETPKQVQDIILPWIHSFYDGKEQLQRDEVMRSVGLIAQTIMLAAKAMNYDSCPMIGFDQEKVASLINLPKDHAIGMMLVVGKIVKLSGAKPGFIEKADMIIENRFS